MKRKHKNKLIEQSKYSKSKRRAASHAKSRNGARARAKVDGIPPTDNLKKLPDETYGDTEIPDHARR